MTKQPNDTAPDLIVLGLEDGQPRAAKFPASQIDLVAKAAKAMNLTVCKAEGPDLVDLAKKLQEGRLYATGRGSVPPIRRDLYDNLVEQLKLAGQPVPETHSGAEAVTRIVQTSACVQHAHREYAPPENASECASSVRPSAESFLIYNGSTAVGNFENGMDRPCSCPIR